MGFALLNNFKYMDEEKDLLGDDATEDGELKGAVPVDDEDEEETPPVDEEEAVM